MRWGWSRRGFGRGYCWYIMQYYLEKGEFPKVKINDEEIELRPGMGIGRLIMLKLLEKISKENKK